MTAVPVTLADVGHAIEVHRAEQVGIPPRRLSPFVSMAPAIRRVAAAM